MGIRNKQVSATVVLPVVVFLLYVFWSVVAFGSTFQHYIQQVRRTDGQVMAGAQVNVYLPGSNTRATIYSNISGTTIKSQPITTDSVGFFDFYLGDQVVDVLIQGNNFPTTKLTNVTLSALATAGILTVPNGGTGVNTLPLNTVLLGNDALPIKTSSVGLANQVFRVPNAGGQPDFGQINLSSSAAVVGVLPAANGGTGSTNGSVLRVKEQDSAPNVPNVTEIRVTNGTLTDNGSGIVSLAISGVPVVDTSSIVFGSSDSSKQLRFEVDGFSASTVRVLTPPNADVTIAGTNFLNAWADGIKQTFNPSGTNAGLNVGAHTTDPSVPVNGDTYYNSTSDKFRCYENGSWSDCINSGSGTTPGGADTNVQFNNSNAFGGSSDFIWNNTAKFLGIGATAALMDEGLIVTNLASHNGVIASLRANNDAPPGNSAGFRAFKARGTVGTPSAVQSGDWLLGLSSNAYDSTGYFGTARLFSEATQTHTATKHGTRWTFSTTPNDSTTITDTVRIPQDGGVQLLTGTKPACSSSTRGYIYTVAGGAGVADTYEVCDKNAADIYAWKDVHEPTLPVDGWVAAGVTFTYASADSPTFTFTITGVDLRTTYTEGTRIKLTQSTGGTKYFLVTAVAFGSDTTVTIFGGTQYTLNNEAITSPFYSHIKGPPGFSLDPNVWALPIFTDNSNREQLSPSAGTWYNPGTITVSVPIGIWRVIYQTVGATSKPSTTTIQYKITLSTANNSESDSTNSVYNRVVGASASLATYLSFEKEIILNKASKTSYFLNIKTDESGVDAVQFRGDVIPTIIRVFSTYL